MTRAKDVPPEVDWYDKTLNWNTVGTSISACCQVLLHEKVFGTPSPVFGECKCKTTKED